MFIFREEITTAVNLKPCSADQVKRQLRQNSHVPKQQRLVTLTANHPSNPLLDFLVKPNASVERFVCFFVCLSYLRFSASKVTFVAFVFPQVFCAKFGIQIFSEQKIRNERFYY